MKLYLIHCGYYDLSVCDGIYEGHVNLFVVANGFEEARSKIRMDSVFRSKKMHVDGVQEIDIVGGYKITPSLGMIEGDQTVLKPELFRDL